jgi:hypothetical protein
MIFEHSYIKPIKTSQMGIIYLGDVVKAECLDNKEKSELESWIPSQFVIKGTDELCDRFNLVALDGLLNVDSSLTRLRWPNGAEEENLAKQAWFNVIKSNPDLIVGSKLMWAADILKAEMWAPQFKGNSPLVFTNSWSSSQATNNALLFSRFLNSLLTKSNLIGDVLKTGFAACIALPFACMVWAKKKRKKLFLWGTLGLVAPAAWVLQFSLITPWNDTRYISPIVVWSLLFSLLFIVEVSENTLRDE